MRIGFLDIKNYRVFKRAQIGAADAKPLPGLSVFIGANSSGKSTLLDVFDFLRDALIGNVRTALQRRGGFKEVRSRDVEGPIAFEIGFLGSSQCPQLIYNLEIDERGGQPIVAREVLKCCCRSGGHPHYFLDFNEGKGFAVTDDAIREEHKLKLPETLAIKGLGQFQRFKAASSLCRAIENWHTSGSCVEQTCFKQGMDVAKQLLAAGENLSLAAKYLFEQHRDVFDVILRKMAWHVPGVTKVEAESTVDGRVVLRFQDGAFKDPFLAKYASDGTIALFSYLVLLHAPSPHPLLCVAEPERHLYYRLLGELVEEFRNYAGRGCQVMVSTHSPDFLNAVKLDEVFWLTKVEGYTRIRRASEVELLQHLVQEEEYSLGALWRQGFFDGVA